MAAEAFRLRVATGGIKTRAAAEIVPYREMVNVLLEEVNVTGPLKEVDEIGLLQEMVGLEAPL